jgi:hypothetical protein
MDVILGCCAAVSGKGKDEGRSIIGEIPDECELGLDGVVGVVCPAEASG